MAKRYAATRHDQAQAGMGVPVYISEVAVGVTLALYGPAHPFTQAFNRHNVRLHSLGLVGAIERMQLEAAGREPARPS